VIDRVTETEAESIQYFPSCHPSLSGSICVFRVGCAKDDDGNGTSIIIIYN